MVDDKLVSGDGWISDESEFYGTARKKRRLEAQCENANTLQLVREWQKYQQVNPVPVIGAAGGSHVEQHLHNPYEHKPGARQLVETIPEFIKRMHPLTSTGDGAWIWIANPIPKGKGNGLDGREPKSDLPGFEKTGSRLLEQFAFQCTRVEEENAGKAQSTITRKLGPYRDKLKEDILAAAIKCGVTSGKWMLFPNEDQVTSTWRTVCEAVTADDLGTAAKVAAADPFSTSSGAKANSASQRLICIYTRDFSDVADVRRVLDGIVELDLVPNQGYGIYYKCDAYTYLDIGSNNPFKLKASLYSSREMLKTAESAKKKMKHEANGGGRVDGGLEGWMF